MKTNLMRAALIAAFTAGAALPGEAAAKPPGGNPPDSKPLPPGYFKKKVFLHCNAINGAGQPKILIGNSLNHALSSGTRIYWRAKGSRGNASGAIWLGRPLPAGGHIFRNVPAAMNTCRAWIVVSINLNKAQTF